MKTILRVGAVNLLAVSVASAGLFGFESPEMVLADPQYVFLGRRAITENGYEGVKTYISQSDVVFYQSTGRTVYSQIGDGPPWIEGI